MSPLSHHDLRLELKAVFAADGVRGALRFLNSLTGQRFTSLYQFAGETLRNITLYDREYPDVQTSEDIPVMASYCVFVRDSGARFTVEDSLADERVKDHPKRSTVQCYCGVPLLDRDGKIFGSICHFDFKPGRVADRDVELMEYMAGLLQAQS